MLYPRFNQIQYKTSSIVNTLGDGVNTYGTPLTLKPSEARRLLNVSNRELPSLCTRYGRSLSAEQITTPNGAGERNNQYLHVIDGTTWQYWNGTAWVTVKDNLSNKKSKLLDFNTGDKRYTILMNGADRYAWDGTTATDLTQAPLADKFTANKQRLYAAKDTVLSYSNLNLLNDWTTVNCTGSTPLTNAKGNITAVTTYGGYVTVFTEFSMHILYGTDPSNYELIDIPTNIGCVSDKSVITCNNVLYFASLDGIYAFKGSEPSKISHKVNEYYNNINMSYRSMICAGAVGNELYFSIPSTSTSITNDLLLHYDTMNDKWYIESGNILDFVRIGDVLYGIDKDGYIWNMQDGDDDNGEAISWHWVSAPRYVKPSSRQTLSKVWILYDMQAGSTLDVYVSETFDSDDWTLVSSLDASDEEQNKKIIIPINVGNDIYWYRIKLVGTGKCVVHYIEEVFRVRE